MLEVNSFFIYINFLTSMCTLTVQLRTGFYCKRAIFRLLTYPVKRRSCVAEGCSDDLPPPMGQSCRNGNYLKCEILLILITKERTLLLFLKNKTLKKWKDSQMWLIIRQLYDLREWTGWPFEHLQHPRFLSIAHLVR